MARRIKNVGPTQTALPLPGIQNAWETKGIFSEHYIRTRLKNSLYWPKEEEVKSLWEFCASLWDKRYLGLARGNEAITRQEFLDKVLTKLGFAYLPNTHLPVGERRREPDYLLFVDEATKNEVLAQSKMAQYAAALALLEAKKVNHPLDAVSRHETPGRFPHQQVRDYLQAAADYSGKRFFNWAILTNGNRWRLYCRDAHPGSYFEYNFEIGVKSLQKFMVFVTLFRPAAFIRNSEGKCPLDYLRAEALQYQGKLEDDLRKRVFKILVRLANGFYQRSENRISRTDLDELYQNSLIFLYRLLFVLYAEGRGLLPVKTGVGGNKNYRERYSLQRLLPQLSASHHFPSDEFTELYESLLGLFHLINGNQPSRNKACDVPRYNGGLFESKEYKLLERWRIGEKTLADVLRGLMFSPIPAGKGEQEEFDFGETIDYADLEVRQLGSIYEGLLENHLELEGDSLVLRGDRAERKATGTYYTPDYIVQYIKKNTLGPLCAEINKSSEVQGAIKREVKDNSFAEAVLKLNILDPAMGSGHFLVRATEFLADEIVRHPTTEFQTQPISSPLSREEIISQGKVPVTRGLSHEEAEISYWRRRVVESCIYGVDLNPLAVELAKLSLWLTCIATDQPLSFLDHHLRPGNSLIGARLRELGAFPEKKKTRQTSLSFGPDLPKAVSEAIRALKEIGETETVDISTVEEKKSRWHKEVWSRLEPYRTVADLWTSTFFGTQINETTYQHLAKLLALNPMSRTKEARELKKKMKPYLVSLGAAQNKGKFFHWELEFPEVFFNEDGTPKENPGFDAVIGNPPYGAEFDELERSFIGFRFPFSKNNKNSAMVFTEKGLETKKVDGYLAYIVPKSLSFSQKWSSGRKLILHQLGTALDVSKAFEGVLLEQMVIIVSDHFTNQDCYESSVLTESKKVTSFPIKKEVVNLNDTLLLGIDDEELKIFEKISGSNFFLRDISESSRGLPFQKFVRTTSTDVPIFRGDHIARFSLFDSSETVPEEVLGKAKSKVDFLRQPKVLSQNIIAHVLQPTDHIILMSVLDKEGILTLDTVENTVLTDKRFSLGFITSLMNSKLFSWYAYRFVFGKAIRTMHLEDYHIGKLPISRIAFVTPKDERQRLLEKLKADVETGRLDEVLAMVDDCLSKDEKGNFITESAKSDVVHDLLAFLAKQMIEMNKKRQKLVKEFLTWLEREIVKGSIEGLKNKTKIKEFHDYDFDALIEVLRQNRLLPKLIAFGDQRQEALRKAYEATMSRLTPLKQKIAATDSLIDQIVYKLYGLTEEEIKIVEGGLGDS